MTERGRSPDLYDIISDPAKRLAHEGEFLKRLLARAPGRRVLDMSCATGVHAEFLATQGAEVTARDISAEAVETARAARPHERITYEIADMREPRGGPFDLCITMGNTLSLVGEYPDVLRSLSAVREMMSPAALGFVHVVNYHALEREGARHKVARRETADGEIVIVKSMTAAKGAGALVSFSYFERKGGQWEVNGSQSVLLDLRREKLLTLVDEAGLAVEEEYGDYDLSAFVADKSPDLLLVLKRKP